METTFKKQKPLDFGLSEKQMILTHHTTDENTEGNSTYIDFEPINNNPDSILFVTTNLNPNTRVHNNHPIGVWFNAKKGLWGIYNQDKKIMPIGLIFNVLVSYRRSEDSTVDPLSGYEGIPFKFYKKIL
jgi:hypothetical protein